MWILNLTTAETIWGPQQSSKGNTSKISEEVHAQTKDLVTVWRRNGGKKPVTRRHCRWTHRRRRRRLPPHPFPPIVAMLHSRPRRRAAARPPFPNRSCFLSILSPQVCVYVCWAMEQWMGCVPVIEALPKGKKSMIFFFWPGWRRMPTDVYFISLQIVFCEVLNIFVFVWRWRCWWLRFFMGL